MRGQPPSGCREPRASAPRALQRTKGNIDIARAQKNGDPATGPREMTKRERSG